jgi:hypothetical protein
MDVFLEALLVFAAVFLGSIPVITLLIRSRVRSGRKRARLELKRHLQKMEVHESMWN